MEEKLQINIYKGLPMVLGKVKGVALSAVIGKSNAWSDNKLNRRIIKGVEKQFVESDLPLINNGLENLGNEILQSLVTYSTDRDEVIAQVKELCKFVSMPYIYTEVLKVKRSWIESRMRCRSKEGKACSFKEDDILRINMAAMQIANELKSIELVL